MRFLLLLCLVARAFCEQRVVGGTDVDIADHPHQLSMRVMGLHVCGAALISNSRAVTAAHCCGSGLYSYDILGGTSDRTVTTCSTCVEFVLTDIDIYPYFVNGLGYPYDLAVLSFLYVAYNSNFQPILLASAADGLFTGDRCTITGWGLLSGDGIRPQQLQGANMTVITNDECAAVYGDITSQVCLSDTSAAHCNGDDGGPLVCGSLLVGVSTVIAGNCSSEMPSAYTRISIFYEWILSI